MLTSSLLISLEEFHSECFTFDNTDEDKECILALDVHLFFKHRDIFEKKISSCLSCLEKLKFSANRKVPSITIWTRFDQNASYYLRKMQTLDWLVPRKQLFFVSNQSHPPNLNHKLNPCNGLMKYKFVLTNLGEDTTSRLCLINQAESIGFENTAIAFFTGEKNHELNNPDRFTWFRNLIDRQYPFYRHPFIGCDEISMGVKSYFLNKLIFNDCSRSKINLFQNLLHNYSPELSIHRKSSWPCLCFSLSNLLSLNKGTHCDRKKLAKTAWPETKTNSTEFPLEQEKFSLLYQDWHYIYDSFESL